VVGTGGMPLLGSVGRRLADFVFKETKVPSTVARRNQVNAFGFVADEDLVLGTTGAGRGSSPQMPAPLETGVKPDALTTPEKPPVLDVVQEAQFYEGTRFVGAKPFSDIKGNPDAPNFNEIVRSIGIVSDQYQIGGTVEVRSPTLWTVRLFPSGDTRNLRATRRRFRFSTRSGELRSPDIDLDASREPERRLRAFETDPAEDRRRLNAGLGGVGAAAAADEDEGFAAVFR